MAENPVFGLKVTHMQGAKASEAGVYNSDSQTYSSFEIRFTVHEVTLIFWQNFESLLQMSLTTGAADE